MPHPTAVKPSRTPPPPPSPDPSEATAGTTSRQQPTVGRIVHYGVENFDTIEAHAAIITRVFADKTAVTVNIFHPSGSQNIQDAEYSEELKVGCWSWPPRD
jgi:hypothetical protein